MAASYYGELNVILCVHWYKNTVFVLRWVYKKRSKDELVDFWHVFKLKGPLL